jgi:hypothetical protein
MIDTYVIGSIPPLSAWPGETLTFKVTSKLGNGVKFWKRAMPSPKGKVSIDENTGVFTYEPAPEDKEQFAVWIKARKGAKDDAPQKIFITPRPQLPSEFDVIEHVSQNPPDKASSFYTTFSKEDAGKAHFNREGLESDVELMTKKVTIAGVNVVIEESADDGSIYKRLIEVGNKLRQLTLCADKVVIRCDLKLPGTEVHIYARELRFEDADGKIARLDTTPEPVKNRAKKLQAMRGQKGGDVHLFVLNLITPGTAHRIICKGGKGQAGAHGQKGGDGTSVPAWNGKVVVEGKTFDFTDELKNRTHEGTPVYVSVYQHKTHTTEEFRFHWPSDVWPTDGQQPVAHPRLPGAGGLGGSLYTRFKEQLESRVNLSPGDTGDPADDIPEAAAGKPSPALAYMMVYSKAGPFIDKTKFMVSRQGKPKPYPKVLAPRTTNVTTKSGEILPAKTIMSDIAYWLHPATVRAVLAWADDAYLAGHIEKARILLGLYLDAVTVAVEAAPAVAAWPLLRSEVADLIQRIDSQYDNFGNPAGWVPMLSFQTNYELFQSEMKSAVKTMFLAYWIQHKHTKAKAAADILKKAKDSVYGETDQALKDLEAAERRVAELASTMVSIADQINTIWKLVTDQKKTLTDQVKNDLQKEQVLRGSAKILGGIMQLIPVGQPVLGSVGKALTVLGDIDPDKPADSLGKVAGAFAPVAVVAGEKAKEKAAAIFEGLKSSDKLKETENQTKAREKKEKFDKDVEKKELEAKVKEHLEKKAKAKESILEGFSGFAVSEDDVKARLEKVLAETPGYKEAIKEIEKLNVQKREFNEKLIATLHAIDEATTTIVSNQFAILELRAQRDSMLEQLSLEALQSVQEMGRRARERLLRYQYYVLKSYHYLMLKDQPGIDFRAQKLFDKFSELLSKSENGMLDDAQYNILSAVFNEQLKAIADSIIKHYASLPDAAQTYFVVELTPAQIETLNSAEKSVEIDLLWALNRQQDDIRITKIETNDTMVGPGSPLPTKHVTMDLDYVHDGISRVRREGRLYLFRSGQYLVAEGAGTALRTDFHWGTTLEYNPQGTGSFTVKPKEPDEDVKWLVNDLVSTSNQKKNPMTRFRPGAWTRLAINRSGSEVIKIKFLTLKIHCVFLPIDTKKYTTIAVKVADDAQPFIRCSAIDLNGRGDGAGSFVRTFSRGGSVTLSAPAFYGSRAFLGWRKGAAVEQDLPLDDKDLSLDRSYTLSLNVADYLVEAVYEPLTETSINKKGEEWPACPAGWKFEDWIFVNGTSTELTIRRIWIIAERLDLGAAVNEPLGGVKVKLSFERLKLLRGEATKLSVCLNPESTPDAASRIWFVFKSGSDDDVVSNYEVCFNGEGRPVAFSKGGGNASSSFDVDTENHVVTFTRP